MRSSTLTFAAAAVALCSPSAADMEQVEWVRSKGGYFNPKLHFQSLDPTDPDSPKGVFAAEFIPQGEMVMMLPPNAILSSGGSKIPCDTARNLYKEYTLGEKSEYWPYVKYLYGTMRGRIPSAWSGEGKKLLQTIRGVELPPAKLTTLSFDRDCGDGDAGNAEKDHAYFQIQSRGWDDKLLPLFDMINHRGGNWSNVDSTSAQRDRDIFAFATKDIPAGDQIYWSYTSCTDCPEPDYTQDVLKWYGFVEQYPQRWFFPANPNVIFELHEVEMADPVTGEVRQQLNVTWQDPKVKLLQVAALRGYLKRLQDIRKDVYKEAKKLESSFERDTALEFFEATKTALQHAVWSGMDVLKSHNSSTTKKDGGDAEVTNFRYDKLEEEKDPLFYFSDVCEMDIHNNGQPDLSKYQKVDSANSHYQEIKVFRNKRNNDTCLTLSSALATCSSFRPHYHEPLVHYPARFLGKVKRVLFIGGGDSMVLHEILKYPSLELVVGLELDQQVVRKSFRHFGAQPHFDDERVQWWFGDAARSLSMLPRSYYGTFDMVLVDLETDLINTLNVTRGARLIDVAKLLMKPNGLIARNEDFFLGATDDEIDFKVGLYFNNVPVVCEKSIYMGSSSVDLFKRPVNDKKIESFTLSPPLEKAKNLFAGWNDYSSRNRTSINDCLDSRTTETNEFVNRSLGVLMVLEVENITTTFDSPSAVQETIRKGLKEAGVTETSIALSSYTEGEVAEMVFILQEGYVVAHVWPGELYCGFDIQLWSEPDKLDIIKAKLINTLGSETFSSYRVVTGGIFGAPHSATDSLEIGPPPDSKCARRKKNKCASPMDPGCHVPEYVHELSREKKQALNQQVTTNEGDTPTSDHGNHSEVPESFSRDRSTAGAIDDLDVPPPSLSLKDSYRSVMDGSCHVPNYVGKIRDSEDSSAPDACRYQATSVRAIEESEPEEADDIKIVFQEAVACTIKKKSTVVVLCGKITGSCMSLDAMDESESDVKVIPIFPCYSMLGDIENMEGAERHMEICEEKILNILKEEVERNGKIGGFVIDPNLPKSMGQILIHLVQSPGFRQAFLARRFSVLATVQKKSEEWRKELTERFRTGVIKFHPAHKAEVIFDSAKKDGLELAVFSAGDDNFFLHLAVATSGIQKGTGLVGQVRTVKNGIKPYISDFSPTVTTDDHSYDNRDAVKQWLSQEPLGHQTILQFELRPPDIMYTKGEKVWVYRQAAWHVGKIVSPQPNGKYSITLDGEDKPFMAGHKRIRQIKKKLGEETESTVEAQHLKGPLLDAIMVMSEQGFPEIEIRVVKDIGEGCVIVLFWKTGSIILTYDGRNQIDANIFSVFDWEGRRMGNEFKDHLSMSIPFMTAVARDEQPRGTGRVMNFEYELRSRQTPIWGLYPPPEKNSEQQNSGETKSKAKQKAESEK